MAPKHKKGWINKKTDQHFNWTWRPQNDPLIHDSEAPPMVLNPTPFPNADKSHKSKKLDDLASELGDDIQKIRNNEGEAASHGIYYDDSEYDYMQHMRDVGQGTGGNSYFMEAPSVKGKGKKIAFEDALQAQLDDKKALILDDEILPSKNLRKLTYQAQQDFPDALAGFQPDMDPRLREVLEALDDEAYVDDEDDIFGKLVEDGEELDDRDFEEADWENEDEGWESDHTAKPSKEFREAPIPPAEMSHDEREDHGDGEWMAGFKNFKKNQKTYQATNAPSQSGVESSLFTTTTNGGRRKKRKGALTNPSNYSMTSSSMFRTEALTSLDARFERIEEQYNEDEDEDVASVSAASNISTIQGPMRGDFDNIMDEFLGNYKMSGKKNVKKGKYQTGMEQLDEIRKGLGKARIRN